MYSHHYIIITFVITIIIIIIIIIITTTTTISIPRYTRRITLNKKRRNATKTRFSTIQPSIDVTGIRNKKWQWKKNDAKLKLLSGNLISFFSNSDHDLDHIHLGSNRKLCHDVSYPYSKFGVNRPNQTKVIELTLNFYF